MCIECYLALPGIKLKICIAESPMDAPLMAGLIGISHATDCPFLWLRHKKCSTCVFLFPGVTRSDPQRMSMFELCLRCLPGKRGLISATKVSVGFVLKWVSTIWDLPKSYIILS